MEYPRMNQMEGSDPGFMRTLPFERMRFSVRNSEESASTSRSSAVKKFVSFKASRAASANGMAWRWAVACAGTAGRRPAWEKRTTDETAANFLSIVKNARPSLLSDWHGRGGRAGHEAAAPVDYLVVVRRGEAHSGCRNSLPDPDAAAAAPRQSADVSSSGSDCSRMRQEREQAELRQVKIVHPKITSDCSRTPKLNRHRSALRGR